MHFEKFDFETGDWEDYVDKFVNFMLSENIDEDDYVECLLRAVGKEARNEIRCIRGLGVPEIKSFDTIIKAVEIHLLKERRRGCPHPNGYHGVGEFCCYICLEENDHFAPNCPNYREHRVICDGCDAVGHYLTECPYPKNVSCYYCHEQGHIAPKCGSH